MSGRLPEASLSARNVKCRPTGLGRGKLFLLLPSLLFAIGLSQALAQVQDPKTPQTNQNPDPGGQDGVPIDRVLPPGGRFPPGVRVRPPLDRRYPPEAQPSQSGPAQPPAAPIVAPPAQVVSPGAQPPAQTPPTLKVDYAGGKLSVTAQKVSLSQVLQEVGHRTGLDVRGLSEVGQMASVQFSNVPVGDAIRNLLGGANYALFGRLNSPEGVSRARVVILSATAGAAIDLGNSTQTAQSAVSQAQRSLWRAHLLSADPAEQDAGFREVVKLGPKEAFDALEDVIINGDGVPRLRALQFMDQDEDIDQRAVMGALRDALNDQDSSLRDYAVQAIGRHPGSESIDLLHQVFNDGDAAQRLSVLESISQRTDAKAIIQQAASDPDQAVSGLATELLNNAAAPNQ
ncbi:MAG TPA: HEAT repeat domain-containing protein [Terriglobia bacterium]